MDRANGGTEGAWGQAFSLDAQLAQPNIEHKIYVDGKVVLNLPSSDGGESPEELEGLPQKTPSVERDIAAMLYHKPQAWEYLYYASCLRREIEKISPRWADFETGYVSTERVDLDARNPVAYMGSATRELQKFIAEVQKWFDVEITQSAFGKPGTPGNEYLIAHVALRQAEVQAKMLDWSQRQRDIIVPPPFENALGPLSRLVGLPVKDFQKFVAHLVEEVDKLPGWVRSTPREPFRLELSYVMRIDDAVLRDVSQTIEEIERALT